MDGASYRSDARAPARLRVSRPRVTRRLAENLKAAVMGDGGKGKDLRARGRTARAGPIGVGCVVGRLYAERISVVRKGVALERGPRPSRDHQSTTR